MINNTYSAKRIIGKGGTCNVFLVEDTDGQKYAAKVFKEKTGFTQAVQKHLLYKEVNILSILSDHPNIIKWRDVLENTAVSFSTGDETVNCAILEFSARGTLSNMIKRHGRLDEKIAWFFFIQMLSAVRYMHDSNIAHLDIKPQNILLDDYFNIKISDFGVSAIFKDGEKTWTKRRGTQGYMAPELLPLQREDPYDSKMADIYALGATLAMITCGEIILHHKMSNTESTFSSQEEMMNDSNILQDTLKTLGISEECQDLITAMMSSDPKKRPTAEQLEAHPWVQAGYNSIIPEEIYNYLAFQ